MTTPNSLQRNSDGTFKSMEDICWEKWHELSPRKTYPVGWPGCVPENGCDEFGHYGSCMC